MPTPAKMLPLLYLIRHGDTDWTDSHRHTGRTDIPLNAAGEARARKLRTRLSGRRFAGVFVSPLVRASKTCELAGFSEHAVISADLIEWDYGRYEGLRTAEIRCDNPAWELFRDGAPGGESPGQVAARADRFIEMVRRIDGDAAAFSSGHIIRMIAARWLGLEPIAGQYFYTVTASVGILGYEHDRTEPVIRLWNDAGIGRELTKREIEHI